METKNSLDIIKEMTCKIREATECVVKEQSTNKPATEADKIDVPENK